MERIIDEVVNVSVNSLGKNPTLPDENINFDDIPEITDFSGFKRSPRLAKFREKILADGRYFTRAFDYGSGTVEITEIDASTHEVIGSQVVNLNEIPQEYSEADVKNPLAQSPRRCGGTPFVREGGKEC